DDRFVAPLDPLDADDRRPHEPDRGDEGVVRDLVGRDDGQRVPGSEQLFRMDLPDVRVTAAPGPQNTRADRESFQCLFVDRPHSLALCRVLPKPSVGLLSDTLAWSGKPG